MVAEETIPLRKRVHELCNAADSKYAVFLRTESGRSARFRVLHSSLELAVEVAREHAASAAANGCLDFTYYAIEIKHRVGIEHGKLVDEPMK